MTPEEANHIRQYVLGVDTKWLKETLDERREHFEGLMKNSEGFLPAQIACHDVLSQLLVQINETMDVVKDIDLPEYKKVVGEFVEWASQKKTEVGEALGIKAN